MIEILQREAIYLWYYFSVQFQQIIGYYILGMALGSFVSVFCKEKSTGCLYPFKAVSWAFWA